MKHRRKITNPDELERIRKRKRAAEAAKAAQFRHDLDRRVAEFNTLLHGEPHPTHIFGVGYVSSRDPRYIDP